MHMPGIRRGVRTENWVEGQLSCQTMLVICIEISVLLAATDINIILMYILATHVQIVNVMQIKSFELRGPRTRAIWGKHCHSR